MAIDLQELIRRAREEGARKARSGLKPYVPSYTQQTEPEVGVSPIDTMRSNIDAFVQAHELARYIASQEQEPEKQGFFSKLWDAFKPSQEKPTSPVTEGVTFPDIPPVPDMDDPNNVIVTWGDKSTPSITPGIKPTAEYGMAPELPQYQEDPRVMEPWKYTPKDYTQREQTGVAQPGISGSDVKEFVENFTGAGMAPPATKKEPGENIRTAIKDSGMTDEQWKAFQLAQTGRYTPGVPIEEQTPEPMGYVAGQFAKSWLSPMPIKAEHIKEPETTAQKVVGSIIGAVGSFINPTWIMTGPAGAGLNTAVRFGIRSATSVAQRSLEGRPPTAKEAAVDIGLSIALGAASDKLTPIVQTAVANTLVKHFPRTAVGATASGASNTIATATRSMIPTGQGAVLTQKIATSPSLLERAIPFVIPITGGVTFGALRGTANIAGKIISGEKISLGEAAATIGTEAAISGAISGVMAGLGLAPKGQDADFYKLARGLLEQGAVKSGAYEGTFITIPSVPGILFRYDADTASLQYVFAAMNDGDNLYAYRDIRELVHLADPNATVEDRTDKSIIAVNLPAYGPAVIEQQRLGGQIVLASEGRATTPEEFFQETQDAFVKTEGKRLMDEAIRAFEEGNYTLYTQKLNELSNLVEQSPPLEKPAPPVTKPVETTTAPVAAPKPVEDTTAPVGTAKAPIPATSGVPTPEAAVIPPSPPVDMGKTPLPSKKDIVPGKEFIDPTGRRKAYLAPSVIGSDPDRFQFKQTGEGGVTSLLKDVDKWDPLKAGVLTVWKNRAGEYLVVNGHHRLKKAKELGVPLLEVTILREEDGVTAEDARAIGALQNMAEGRGTDIDAAKFFRDMGATAEDLKEHGLSMKEGVVRDGLALAALTDNIFNAVVQGTFPKNRAIVIGQELPNDPAAQNAVMGLIERYEKQGKPISASVLQEVIRSVKGSEYGTTTQVGLFGEDSIETTNALEKAELIDYVKKGLRLQKKVFGIAAGGKTAEILEKTGNILATEQNREFADRAEVGLELVSKLAHTKGTTLSELFNNAATRLQGSQNKAAVKKDTLDKVLGLIKEGKAFDDFQGEPQETELVDVVQTGDGLFGEIPSSTEEAVQAKPEEQKTQEETVKDVEVTRYKVPETKFTDASKLLEYYHDEYGIDTTDFTPEEGKSIMDKYQQEYNRLQNVPGIPDDKARTRAISWTRSSVLDYRRKHVASKVNLGNDVTLAPQELADVLHEKVQNLIDKYPKKNTKFLDNILTDLEDLPGDNRWNDEKVAKRLAEVLDYLGKWSRAKVVWDGLPEYHQELEDLFAYLDAVLREHGIEVDWAEIGKERIPGNQEFTVFAGDYAPGFVFDEADTDLEGGSRGVVMDAPEPSVKLNGKVIKPGKVAVEYRNDLPPIPAVKHLGQDQHGYYYIAMGNEITKAKGMEGSRTVGTLDQWDDIKEKQGLIITTPATVSEKPSEAEAASDHDDLAKPTNATAHERKIWQRAFDGLDPETVTDVDSPYWQAGLEYKKYIAKVRGDNYERLEKAFKDVFGITATEGIKQADDAIQSQQPSWYVPGISEKAGQKLEPKALPPWVHIVSLRSRAKIEALADEIGYPIAILHPLQKNTGIPMEDLLQKRGLMKQGQAWAIVLPWPVRSQGVKDRWVDLSGTSMMMSIFSMSIDNYPDQVVLPDPSKAKPVPTLDTAEPSFEGWMKHIEHEAVQAAPTEPTKPKLVITQIPERADDRGKSWRRVITDIDSSKKGAYAFVGSKWLAYGRKAELPVGTTALFYDEIGSVKHHDQVAKVMALKEDGTWEIVSDEKGELTAIGKDWALELRDRTAKALGKAPAKTKDTVKPRETPPVSVEPKAPKTSGKYIASAKDMNKAKHLRVLADRMQTQIDAKKNPAIGAQRPTARRARIAQDIREDAEKLEHIQTVLYSIAKGLEDGTLPNVLRDITTKTQIETIMNSRIMPSPGSTEYGRLERAKILTPQQFKEAKDLIVDMKHKKSEADLKAETIAKAERDLIGTKIPGYFPTPKPIVDRMLEEAGIEPGMSVLEPSAGKGNIADVVKTEHPEAKLSVNELSPTLTEVLGLKGYKPTTKDFLAMEGQYDRIIMNPPFERYQDVDHVQHAYKLLKLGGKLVSIMSPSAFNNQAKKAAEFREWFDKVGGVVEDLPAGSFKSSERPTGVATRLVVIDKPMAARRTDIEPWQMTKAEYVEDSQKGALGRQKELNKKMAPTIHKNLVGLALKEGKPVPTKVLDEYPDLEFSETIPEELRGELTSEMSQDRSDDLYSQMVADDRQNSMEPAKKGFVKPKKTIKAYKLFRTLATRPGEIFPLFIGKTKPTPVGEWVPAEFIPTKGYAERPGWHTGMLPHAPHLMRQDGSMPKGRIWAEVELPADVDWQHIADQSKTKDIRDRIPEGGHYKFQTSKMQGGFWYIGGAIKVNRILSSHEVNSILKDHGLGGGINSATTGGREAGLERADTIGRGDSEAEELGAGASREIAPITYRYAEGVSKSRQRQIESALNDLPTEVRRFASEFVTFMDTTTDPGVLNSSWVRPPLAVCRYVKNALTAKNEIQVIIHSWNRFSSETLAHEIAHGVFWQMSPSERESLLKSLFADEEAQVMDWLDDAKDPDWERLQRIVDSMDPDLDSPFYNLGTLLDAANPLARVLGDVFADESDTWRLNFYEHLLVRMAIAQTGGRKHFRGPNAFLSLVDSEVFAYQVSRQPDILGQYLGDWRTRAEVHWSNRQRNGYGYNLMSLSKVAGEQSTAIQARSGNWYPLYVATDGKRLYGQLPYPTKAEAVARSEAFKAFRQKQAAKPEVPTSEKTPRDQWLEKHEEAKAMDEKKVGVKGFDPDKWTITESRNDPGAWRINTPRKETQALTDEGGLTPERIEEVIESLATETIVEPPLTQEMLDKDLLKALPLGGKQGPKPSGKTPTGKKGIITRRELLDHIRNTLVPVRYGHMGIRARGLFKIWPRIVRTRMANDLYAVAHEVGHAIDDALDLHTPALLKNRKLSRELIPLGSQTSKASYTPLEVWQEGIAEFVRLYFMDPAECQKQAPEFLKVFEDTIDQVQGLRDILLSTRHLYQAWQSQPALARILGSISKAKQDKAPVTWDSIYAATIHSGHFFDVFARDILGPNAVLTPSGDPGSLATLAKSCVGRALACFNKGVMDKNFKVISPSLEQVLKPVKDRLDEFTGYMVAKHALELDSYGIESGIDPADAKKVVTLHEKEMLPVLDALMKFKNNVAEQTILRAGLISKEAWRAMRQKYPYHVPFYRVFSESRDVAKWSGKSGYANLPDPIKKLKGSARDIIWPLESIVKDVFTMVNLAARNEVGQAVVRLAETHKGAGKWVDEIPTPMYATTFALSELEDALAAAGADVSSINLDTLAKIFRPTFTPPGKECCINVFFDGERHTYQLDKDLYRAILALDKDSVNMLVKLLRYPTSWLRAGATLSLEFINTNPIRDQFSAFLFAKYGFTPGVDFFRGLAHVVKKDDLYWQWMASGGAQASFASLDRDYLQGTLHDLLGKGMAWNPVEWLRTLSEVMEDATRVGMFLRAKQTLGDDRDAILESSLTSREGTVDFLRRGWATGSISSTYAFANAGLQGTDKFAREFRKQPMKMLLKCLTAITIPSIILYMLNRKNKEYQEKNQKQKDLYWFIPIGDQLIRLPKPFEPGIIFGTGVERFLQYVDTQDPRAFDGLAKEIVSGVLPDLWPTALVPWVELYGNKRTYTGTTIIPEREKNLPPEQQFGPYTSETAKWIGNVLKQSPRVIDHLIIAHFAGLGRLVLDATDLALYGIRHVANKEQPPKKASKGLARVPGIRAFIQEPYVMPKSVDDVYTLSNDLEIKLKRAQAGTSKITAAEIKQLKALREAKTALSKCREIERAIEEHKTMTGQQKQAALIKLRELEVDIARRALGKED